MLKLPPTTPGLERRHADRVAAGERQLLDVLGLDRLAHRDVGLQRPSVSAVTVTSSVSAPVSSVKSSVERAGGVELHVGAADLLEAAQLDNELVPAGRQVGKCVEAAAVGDGRAGLLGLGARDCDGRARNDATLCVLDRARDCSSIELCKSRRRSA